MHFFPLPRAAARAVFVLFVFAVSILPAVATLQPVADRLTPGLPELIEMRPLAPLPTHWEGRWLDIDKNYRNFEKGFADHLGLRNLMVRTKNEIDFRLFKTSRRVYFGRKGELYGRSLADLELPNTEKMLSDPAVAAAVYQGMMNFSERLKAQGVTLVLLAPMDKQYFTQDRIPLFMPRMPQSSHFMQLYHRFQQAPGLQFVDVYGILAASQARFPIYYRQDFHWTDLSAMTVAAEVTNRIARLEGLPPAWRHELAYHDEPYAGSETRFAARLITTLPTEPQLTKTWQDVHQVIQMDPGKSGFESVTDTVSDRGLLPAACLFGNSFSDGMMRAGLGDHFEQFTRLDRAMRLPDAPALINGRCKYLIVQVLDNTVETWRSMSQ
ncbi:alginate O-acetyltransferase AlgX-related protein [Duganella hordei]|uniref:alginate O-acetyltransferase AlgX-related protein n=1 Tax=Duganella hordei TaxID=2865934 RepID=UPI0030E960CD